jgi:hypothetical protein
VNLRVCHFVRVDSAGRDLGEVLPVADVKFYERRALQELSAAMAASDRCARRIHLELADAYSSILRNAVFSDDAAESVRTANSPNSSDSAE